MEILIKSKSPNESLTHRKLKVYYDGLCPLCSREIYFYRTKDVSSSIDWVDITAIDFDPQSEGLDPKKVHQFFHVKTESGQLVVGVDGFIEIWSRIPALKNWERFASVPGIKPLMRLGYSIFAKVRPYLPRKSVADCPSDQCFVGKEKG